MLFEASVDIFFYLTVSSFLLGVCSDLILFNFRGTKIIKYRFKSIIVSPTLYPLVSWGFIDLSFLLKLSPEDDRICCHPRSEMAFPPSSRVLSPSVGTDWLSRDTCLAKLESTPTGASCSASCWSTCITLTHIIRMAHHKLTIVYLLLSSMMESKHDKTAANKQVINQTSIKPLHLTNVSEVSLNTGGSLHH